MIHTIADRGRPARILLVEDSEADVLLTRRAFERARLKIALDHVPDGAACMAFLRKEGPYGDAQTPDLILLDLNMPIMDGREVMSAIATDPALRQLSVVVLTTSSAEHDVVDMHKQRCSSYIVKPVDFDQFQRVVSELGSYWFELVALPPRP